METSGGLKAMAVPPSDYFSQEVKEIELPELEKKPMTNYYFSSSGDLAVDLDSMGYHFYDLARERSAIFYVLPKLQNCRCLLDKTITYTGRSEE